LPTIEQLETELNAIAIELDDDGNSA